MTESQTYLDLTGSPGRRWPSAYADSITRSCPNCRVAAMELCINPLTGRPRKAPCLDRETQGWG